MKKLALSVIMVVIVLAMPWAAGAETQIRGVMVSPNVQPSDLQVLGLEWKANLIRWQLVWGSNLGGPADSANLEQYDAWLESALKQLDAALPVCQAYGIRVLVDLHTTPGGRTEKGESKIFKDAKYQAKLVEVWGKIARRYAGSAMVWGYDIANEPYQISISSGAMDWHQLSTKAAQAIRGFDSAHTIVVEPDSWGDPRGFATMLPLPASIANVVYSPHMYLPHQFTHQGVAAGNRDSFRYPGPVKGKVWDKAELRKSLQPVVDFQNRYGVRILVGEFSVARWAPAGSGYNYLKDVIDIFESLAWDWTYHAFREWQGWSVEHTEEKNNVNRAPKQTNRERLLRTWFSRNSRIQP